MASYYKFAERQADSFVNWAEIGKGITDMIQTEVAIREQKKTAIDQATRENLKKVAEAPVGSHEGLNTWTLNYADSAREAILLQDRLLKQGMLKLKDYTVMRQNLNDGTDELFGVIKNYQNVFKEKRDRMISNDPANRSQAFEMDLMAYTEQFSDFSKSMAIIDPRNFSVNVGIMEPDPDNQGVMKVGKTIATASFLRKIQDTKVDYFDSESAADKMAKAFGSYERAIIDKVAGLEGRVTTINDVTENPEFDKMFDEAFKSISSNPFHISSMLTEDIIQDDKGNPYVSNISGKKGNVIKYVFDSKTNYYSPEFTPEQMKAAKDRFRTLIEMRLDSSIKQSPYNKPQPKEVKSEAPSGNANIQQQLQGIKNQLTTTAGTVQQGSTVFQSANPLATQKNLQKLFSSSPATSGKYKVKTMATDPEDVKSKNLVLITDNNDNLVVSYDVTEIPISIEGRRALDSDVIDKVINTEFERLVPGSYLMGGQNSGGLNYSNF